MHREILFRGKTLVDRYDHYASTEPDTKQGEWVFGDLITKYPHHKGLTIVEAGCIYHEVDPETVGQYTGLMDRNGVRIFEGDFTYHHRHEDTAYLVWHEQHICFAGKPFEGDISERYYYQKLDEPDLEVIGNIHDNPGLLEVYYGG